MGIVCVSPSPPKLPACGSRLGGLLSLDGRQTSKTLLRKADKLLNSASYLQSLVLGKRVVIADLATDKGGGEPDPRRKDAAKFRGYVPKRKRMMEQLRRQDASPPANTPTTHDRPSQQPA